MLLLLVIVRIYSFTQPVCDRPQHTVIHSTKQKAADALSGPNISPLNGQKMLPNIFLRFLHIESGTNISMLVPD